MQNGLATRVSHWGAKPFSEDMDWVNWILFVGFVTVLVVLWTRVLKTLEI